MKMTEHDRGKDDAELEAHFAATRATAVEAPDALMARILRDAQDVQGGFAASNPVVAAVKSGFWAQLLAGVGGWPAASGLAAATLVGVWIGISPPTGLDQLANSYFPTTSATVYETDFGELMPDFYSILAEG